MNFNEQQLSIINDNLFLTEKQALCIIACAGSGKTTTLIQKIIFMINILDCKPEDFYITTFTRNATNVLKKRLLNNLNQEQVDELTIGTFHSIAYSIVLKNNDIVDNKIDIPVDNYLFNYYEFLTENEANLKYKYIFIDEFQDINEIQNLIIKKLFTNAILLVTVGDDQQNIYTFRNTSIKYILNYKSEYNGSYKFLTVNYRSNPAIVALANCVTKYNKNKIDKEMLIGSNEENIKPKLNVFLSEKNEETHVIHRIIDLLELNVPFNEIAILSRTNKKLYKIENTLAKYNIPTKNLETIQDNITHINKNDNDNRIILSTIHGSKGLEFSYVFLIGCVDGHFPLLANDIEEERRLFYVAITRAKKILEISCITYKEFQLPSRFIQEIYIDNKDLLDININMKFDKIKYKSLDENNFVKRNVTSIIKNINYDDIIEMKKLNLLPNYETINYTTEIIHTELKNDIISENKTIITNIDNLFGVFIDVYITRTIQQLTGDIYMYDYLKYDSMLINYSDTLHKSIKMYLNDNNKINNIIKHQIHFKNNDCDLLDEISEDKLLKLYNTIEIIGELKFGLNKSIFENKYLSKNFKKQLMCSYNNFSNKDLNSIDILWDILIVSFIKEIDQGRYAIQYILESLHNCQNKQCSIHKKVNKKNAIENCDDLSNDELKSIGKKVLKNLKIDLIKFDKIKDNKEWFDNVNVYISNLVTSVNKNIHPQTYLKDITSGIHGYSDIVINDEEIMDVKCTTNKKPQLEYLLQILLYMSIYNLNDKRSETKKINKVSIYNPIYGVKYTWTLDDYTIEQQRNLLDYLNNKINNSAK